MNLDYSSSGLDYSSCGNEKLPTIMTWHGWAAGIRGSLSRSMDGTKLLQSLLIIMPRTQSLKMAFVTIFDALNIEEWSGTPYYMAKSLKKQSIQIHYLGPLKERFPFLYKIKQRFYRYILKKSYLRDREPAILKSYAEQVSKKLLNLDVDIVFSPGTIPVAYLDCSKPIIYWTDATFGGMIDFYPTYYNLCKNSLENGYKMELSAITNAKLAIYSSEWAAETARVIYQADKSKVKVVPFGANIECNRTLKDINEIIMNKESNKCNLLFLGKDWIRKGGDLALEIVKELNMIGLETKLTIIGCQPNIKKSFHKFVDILGYVNKSTTEGRLKIDKMLAECHFLILPSMADATPIVFCEANSFGVPCISTTVGGVTSIIKDNINGALFSKNDKIADYCEFIYNNFTNYNRYTELAVSSFNIYESVLNWTVASNKIKNYIIDAI